jgi:membrane protein implicated in regulation of membrane protease activity
VKAFAVYTAGRLLVFVGCAALLYVVGLRGFPLVFVALLVSVPLSFVLLSGARAALAADVERRVAGRRARREDLRSRLRGDDGPVS